MGSPVSRAEDKAPYSTTLSEGRASSMSDEPATPDLFDRRERVWHEGQFDLAPSCVAEDYIRHDEAGDRTVTREAYVAEIAKIREERPTIRAVVYDHSFKGDRAWFRFSFKWPDPETGEPRSRAGMQSYRIESGKLAETWLSLQPLGSAWTDAAAQEHWTSPPPTK
jgi:predicted SnoaL-like aldol condensation-catalyzing enzyme